MLSFSFSNTTHQRTAAHGVQHSSVAAVQNFISLTAMALAAQKNKLNWLQYNIYGVMRHHKCELQVSNIEKSGSKWLDSGKSLTQHLKAAS